MNEQHKMSLEYKRAKAIVGYSYVCKQLKKNPREAIKYIQENRDLFPFITEEQIKNIDPLHENGNTQ